MALALLYFPEWSNAKIRLIEGEFVPLKNLMIGKALFKVSWHNNIKTYKGIQQTLYWDINEKTQLVKDINEALGILCIDLL